MEHDLMRTTNNIDDDLIRRTAQLTGIREKTSPVKLDVETLISRENGKRLARLKGTEKKLETIPRRRAKGRLFFIPTGLYADSPDGDKPGHLQ